MFKVGQKVFVLGSGWGEVTDVRETSSHPVFVTLAGKGVIKTFTRLGQEYIGSARILFFREIVIPSDALSPPWEPDFKKGDVVEIIHNSAEAAYYREVIQATPTEILFRKDGEMPGRPLVFTRKDCSFRKIGEV